MILVVVVTAVLVPLASAIIQQNERSDDSKWTRALGWAGIATAVHSLAVVYAVGSRGYSKSSAALVAVGLLAAGAYLVLSAEVKVRLYRGDWTAVRFAARPRQPSTFLRYAMFAWASVVLVLALVPLRYAGTFRNDPTTNQFAARLALNQFNPLAEERTIDVGQCVMTREPGRTNTVVPCGVAHRAELISTVEVDRGCPTTSDYQTGGLDITVAQTSEIEGVRYCFIVPASTQRLLSGRLQLELLPATL